MPAITYGSQCYRRVFGQLPELKLINMFVEQAPTSETGAILQSRKGLTSLAVRGSGPINGIFSAPGVFGGAIFTISNNTLYMDGTSLGTVMGSGPASWAASDTEVVVTRGGTAYSYNGTDLAAISFPDGADVTAVAYVASLFVFVRAGGHQFYWSNILDARTVDALDFASAELLPDDLLDVMAIRGVLYLFGQISTEAWFPSGNADLPFTRIDQRLFSKGVLKTGCTVELENLLFFIGHDGRVYRLADVPDRISDHGIEERISGSATASAFGFTWEGHSFFCIRLDDATFAYDTLSSEWCEFASYGRDNWRASCATNVGPIPYFGDDSSGNVWLFGDTFTDDGEPLEAYFTFLFPITGGVVPVDVLEIRGNVGQTQPLLGDDANPTIEVQYSRDGGNTFSNWRQASFGAQGKYRNRALFRRLGIFDPPGFYGIGRLTDQSPRRISAVYINEAGGGRSH